MFLKRQVLTYKFLLLPLPPYNTHLPVSTAKEKEERVRKRYRSRWNEIRFSVKEIPLRRSLHPRQALITLSSHHRLQCGEPTVLPALRIELCDHLRVSQSGYKIRTYSKHAMASEWKDIDKGSFHFVAVTSSSITAAELRSNDVNLLAGEIASEHGEYILMPTFGTFH
jgi:hypothetical protein